MASWSIFTEIQSVLITYYFGSALVYSAFVIGCFLIGMLAAGVPLRYAASIMLPLVAGLTLGNMVGASGWILNVMLIAVGLIYSYTMIRLAS